MANGGDMQAKNENEKKLIKDFRRMTLKDQAFLLAFAATSACRNSSSIPWPKILNDDGPS
jgi:hypothetical protein